jgi:LemA protein
MDKTPMFSRANNLYKESSNTLRIFFKPWKEELQPGHFRQEMFNLNFWLSGWRLWCLLGIAAIVLLQGIITYNHCVNIQCDLLTWQHQVEVTLQRRKDIIKNLTATVMNYANHESELFHFVSEKRSEMTAPSEQQVTELVKEGRALGDLSGLDSKRLGNFLGNLKIMAENYPQLRASENYQLLMTEMMEITVELEELRKSYNRSLADYETYLRALPNCVYNWLFQFRHYDYIQVDKEVRVVLPFETGIDQAKE